MSPPIHSIVVVTSPIGLHAPPAEQHVGRASRDRSTAARPTRIPWTRDAQSTEWGGDARGKRTCVGCDDDEAASNVAKLLEPPRTELSPGHLSVRAKRGSGVVHREVARLRMGR
eukprot:2626008-Rhodomonas_salina.1